MANQKQDGGSTVFGIDLWMTIGAFALAVLMLVLATQVHAQTLTVLHNFTGGADGSYSIGGFTMDRAGNLYGSAEGGGSQNCAGGCGVIFKLTHKGSGWTFDPLYEFLGAPTGETPYAPPTFGPDGALYGTTVSGGLAGGGTVFRLAPSPNACKTALCPWIETLPYQFTGGKDGAFPVSAVAFDQAGNLYATTAGDGGGNCYGGCGTIYELKPSNGGWSGAVVHTFQGPPKDGAGPNSMIFDDAGDILGTTLAGGAYDEGTIFELIPSGSGWTEKVLYSFQHAGDGSQPDGAMISDEVGNLYGTTSDSEWNTGGTVFEMSPANGGWTLATIYNFSGNGGPRASLTLDAAGDLYGTTYADGAYGHGSVFKLTPGTGGWAYTSLCDFKGDRDGQNPVSNVVFDSVGNLYGTTYRGGQYYQGMVFEITP